MFAGSVDSGCHRLSENIWFVWFKTSYYSGEKVGCHGQTDTRKCEDSARINEAGFAIAQG